MACHAVITWVDGSDPTLFEKRKKYQHNNRQGPDSTAGTTRYANFGEIYICIASILKYAPFIDKIWVVSDQQHPKHIDEFHRSNLCPPKFIEIVDHKQIFKDYPQYLPTFNSITIETLLWSIPSLSENFIYFNDDFIINKPLVLEDWFRETKVVLHGKYRKQRIRQLKKKVTYYVFKGLGLEYEVRPSYNEAQQKGARVAGLKGKFFHCDHHPHNMRKQTQLEFYKNHPALLRKQLKFKFRNNKQFSAISLAQHLEILKNSCVLVEPWISKDLMGSELSCDHAVFKDLVEEQSCFVCIQSLDEADKESLRIFYDVIRNKFRGYLPETITFENYL